MRAIVDDEYSLPAPDMDRFTTLLYVRSLCDPTVLIGGTTGDTFIRRDGQYWMHPGYKVSRDSKTPQRVDRIPATAPEDSKIYQPAAAAATREES